MKKNLFFEEYLIGLSQGLLVDGDLSPAKIIYFRHVMLRESALVLDLLNTDDLIRRIYDFVKDLPDEETGLTDDTCDTMLGLCMNLLLRRELSIVEV